MLDFEKIIIDSGDMSYLVILVHTVQQEIIVIRTEEQFITGNPKKKVIITKNTFG